MNHREQAIFEAALRLAPKERAAYLDRACAGDAATTLMYWIPVPTFGEAFVAALCIEIRFLRSIRKSKIENPSQPQNFLPLIFNDLQKTEHKIFQTNLATACTN